VNNGCLVVFHVYFGTFFWSLKMPEFLKASSTNHKHLTLLCDRVAESKKRLHPSSVLFQSASLITVTHTDIFPKSLFARVRAVYSHERCVVWNAMICIAAIYEDDWYHTVLLLTPVCFYWPLTPGKAQLSGELLKPYLMTNTHSSERERERERERLWWWMKNRMDFGGTCSYRLCKAQSP